MTPLSLIVVGAHAGLPQTIVISCYLALLLLLGLFANRLFKGTKEDYQVASHSIGPFLLLMSLFGTTMTAFALVGSSGEAFKEGVGVYGMLASSSGIIHSLCFFVIGIKVWSLARQYGYTTQIEFFRDRLESPSIGLLLFPILVGLVIPYLLVGVIGAGTVVQSLTAGLAPEMFPALRPDGSVDKGLNGGIPPHIGTLVICGVVLVYVFFGGMRGTAWANTFQTMVFMILGVVTFYVIANKLGGQDNFMENLRKLSGALSEEKATRVDMSKTKFFTYLLIPLSVGMFPHLFQHWMTAKRAETFKLAVVAHPVFIMIVWVPCVLVGVWATTSMLPAKPPLPKLPDGVTVNANAVLPFLVKTQTAPILGGFLAAGVLAAIMSSLDSQFLCIGTIFNNDIVTYYFGKDRFSDKAQVWMTRGFIVLIVAVTYFLSLKNPTSVFALGVWCFSGFSALFPIVFAALYWKRLTAAGAWAGIIAAAGTWFALFQQSNYGRNRTYTVDIAGYETMPVLTIFLASLAAMIIVSLVTKPPSDKTLAKFFHN